jgi:hypothetical protein
MAGKRLPMRRSGIQLYAPLLPVELTRNVSAKASTSARHTVVP